MILLAETVDSTRDPSDTAEGGEWDLLLMRTYRLYVRSEDDWITVGAADGRQMGRNIVAMRDREQCG